MNKTIKVTFPTDPQGLTGRECPNKQCQGYFKVKFGTGLPTTECICPYCGHKAQQDHFFTQAQIKYAESVALKQFIEPLLKDFHRSLKRMEDSTRGGFIQIKVTSTPVRFAIKSYQERDLETHVTCDSCGLEFAVYGVFATCPDCGKPNAHLIFTKSIEVANKRLHLVGKLENDDAELRDALLQDAVSGGVAAFDALGKSLRKSFPEKLPPEPRNLFQNITLLSDTLKESTGVSIESLVGPEKAKELYLFFQVRHICEHNTGVVDEQFVKKLPEYHHLQGHKFALEVESITGFLQLLTQLAEAIENRLRGL